MVADVQAACDAFRELYDSASNGDGCVSIEVAPTLAHDTEATIVEARRLWQRVDRPNVMIKVPGTKAGLPAITELLAAGINVNVTLLFSVDRYREVIEAFMRGVERRIEAGHSVERLHSVASFFVSRVDGQTDPAIGQAGEAAAPLLHRMAIANAIVAYATFSESLLTARWQTIAQRGAAVQRPLWASTSTKDPSLPDTFYVEALIAPDTVNTVPPQTWKAYADHGEPHVRITPQAEAEAARTLARYHELGLPPLAERTAHLEDDGVKKFAASWHSLLDAIEAKAGALTG
jgi:transaldolase